VTTSSIVLIAGVLVLLSIVGSLLFSRRIVVLLTGKYLLKRKLAWVSFVATLLCVALVLIVLSVMSGWLKNFKASFKTMSGDIVVTRQSSSGFSGYEEIIRRAKELPEVEEGVPIIRTAALLTLPGDWGSNFVGVVGLPIEQIDRVMDFGKTLWLQNGKSEGERPYDVPVREPSFALWPNIDYQEITPKDKQATRRPGLIIGSGVIGVKKDAKTKKLNWQEFYLGLWAKLTVMPQSEEVGAEKTTINARTTAYFFIDGSHTQAFQHDNNVYVPFAQLQADLGMAQRTYPAEEPVDPRDPKGPTKQVTMTDPAKTTEIQFKLKEGTDGQLLKEKIQQIVNEVTGQDELSFAPIRVKTWEEQQSQFFNAVENEITIMMTLFGIISLVQVLMIFCIFYTIVSEKTRDIGILKSIGASEWNIAQVFLTYGAAIGFVGGGIGVIIGWQFVKWINEIQDLITKVTGRTIYNSEIYQIDRLPDTINWTSAMLIWLVAVAASIVGALIPAMYAASRKPVESLRFE
jgi:lipoprotein-releasing system permease protein